MTATILLCLTLFGGPTRPEKPNVVLITVDTLRADRLGYYGYTKKTSPHIDALLARGWVFTQARTPEPLTAPALTSMLTSTYPHSHGATRNGLRQRPGLMSVSKAFADQGYQTAAMIANWTLKDRLTGMGEHFDEYHEVLDRKRWFGLFLSEADAENVTDRGIAWLTHRPKDKPFFFWIHYADPHAPYKLRDDFSERLGIRGDASRSERYDSEVAFTDHHIGRLLDQLPKDCVIVFASDHGESLGEHDYWGHGRHLYEPTLHVPMAIIKPGLAPRTIAEPALLLDLAPTLMGLLGMPAPDTFPGYDWSTENPGLTDPAHRTTYYQAHKGAVQRASSAENGRLRGLLEVGIMKDGVKEVYRIRTRARTQFDLQTDPKELTTSVHKRSDISPELRTWALAVEKGLRNMKESTEDLGESDVEMLRSLGYID